MNDTTNEIIKALVKKYKFNPLYKYFECVSSDEWMGDGPNIHKVENVKIIYSALNNNKIPLQPHFALIKFKSKDCFLAWACLEHLIYNGYDPDNYTLDLNNNQISFNLEDENMSTPVKYCFYSSLKENSEDCNYSYIYFSNTKEGLNSFLFRKNLLVYIIKSSHENDYFMWQEASRWRLIAQNLEEETDEEV